MTDYSEYEFHKQLVAFHNGDMEKVAEDEALALKNLTLTRPLLKHHGLSAMFVWSESLEGNPYWAQRAGWSK